MASELVKMLSSQKEVLSRDDAMALIAIAAAVYPPLKQLLDDVLGKSEDSNRALADEVKSILPAEANIHRAVNQLEAEEEKHRRGTD